MDKFMVLSSPNIRNLIASFKHQPRNRGYISNILTFKVNSGYYFIQDNYFIGQQIGKKVFMFKMSMHGDGSGCDLIKQM